MATSARATLLNKTHKVLKKHYQPVLPDAERPLLQHLLFAACLENSPYAAADAAFDRVCRSFYDLNEMRVSSVAELAEMMSELHNPKSAGSHLKRTLQSIFEEAYSFDIEQLRKTTIGQAVKHIAKYDGVTPFAVSYVTQAGLGGHSIPIDRGALRTLVSIGVITPKEAKAGTVPGMERAILKSSGIEFGSLLHQLGADFLAKPYAPETRNVILAIDPDAKSRLPKRGARKKKAKTPEEKETADKKKGTAKDADKDSAKKGPKPKKSRSADTKKKTKSALKRTASTAEQRKSAKPSGKAETAAGAGISKKKPR